jgi:transposase
MLYEYGIVIAKGISQARRRVPEILEDAENGLSGLARELIAEQYQRLIELDEQIKEQDRRIGQLHKNNETSQQIGAIRGVGPITATIAASNLGDGTQFRSGRAYAASLGLVPRQHSTGGKVVLLGISKRGDRYLRTLLIHGARAVLKTVDDKADPLSCWLKTLKQRRGFNVAAVALANKNARTIWALVTRGESYQVAAA